MRLSPASVRLFESAATGTDHPKVAISACLCGEPVRYDGGDKSLQDTLTILNKHLDLQSICPETGAGMGVPRPPVQLVATDSGELRARGRDDAGLDVTRLLLAYGEQSLLSLGESLAGYIVKSRSPSCGFQSTPIHSTDGHPLGTGSGLHIDYFHRQLPWMQITDELQLSDPGGCEGFIARCQVLANVRHQALQGRLVELHAHYTDIVCAMDEATQQRLEVARESGEANAYWQLFGCGLQASGLS